MVFNYPFHLFFLLHVLASHNYLFQRQDPRGASVNWNYAYTPTIWPSILAVSLMLGLAIYSSRRSSIPGAIPLMFGSLFGFAWAGGHRASFA